MGAIGKRMQSLLEAKRGKVPKGQAWNSKTNSYRPLTKELLDLSSEAHELAGRASSMNDRDSHRQAMKAFDTAAKMAIKYGFNDWGDAHKGSAHDHWLAQQHVKKSRTEAVARNIPVEIKQKARNAGEHHMLMHQYHDLRRAAHQTSMEKANFSGDRDTAKRNELKMKFHAGRMDYHEKAFDKATRKPAIHVGRLSFKFRSAHGN